MATSLLIETLLRVRDVAEVLSVVRYTETTKAMRVVMRLRAVSRAFRDDVDAYFSKNERGKDVLHRLIAMTPLIQCRSAVTTLAQYAVALADTCPDVRCIMPRSLLPCYTQNNDFDCLHTTEWCLSLERAIVTHALSADELHTVRTLIHDASPRMARLDQLGIRWALWRAKEGVATPARLVHQSPQPWKRQRAT